MDYMNWYFEDYDGQDTSDFDYIGVAGKSPQKITDIDTQIKELERRFGDCLIRIYKSTAVGV